MHVHPEYARAITAARLLEAEQRRLARPISTKRRRRLARVRSIPELHLRNPRTRPLPRPRLQP